MKKFVPILALLFLGTLSAKATNTVEEKVVPNYVRGYGNSFIFVENGITFSVYPDGEFDFYIDNQVNIGVGARIGNVGVTFNSGYNYNPFVQYDDYGAIVQVENVPIYYDYYGRVSQIGGVDVWYRNGRVRRVGGLNVFWNGGVFSHYTGFINVYNRNYVYRPFHRWFVRPGVGFCNVWRTPYRRFYNPVRYTWYRPYRNNVRRAYAKIGREYRYDRAPRRANVYRNDRRVAVRRNSGRSNRDYNRGGNAVAERRTVGRQNNAQVNRNGNRNNVSRNNNNVRRSSTVARTNRGNTVTQRTVTRTPRSTSVTKRQVTRTPNRTTTTRKTTTTRSSNRAVAQNRSNTVKRSTASKRTTTRSASNTRRSTSGTKNRSSRSVNTRSARR